MNIVDSSPLVLFQISALVTLNACYIYILFGKLKFFNFKQGRMIPYKVRVGMSRLLGNAMSALVLVLLWHSYTTCRVAAALLQQHTAGM